MTGIVEMIRKIVETEVRKIHLTEFGIVTSVFPHSQDSDKDNYECNVKLKDKDVELRKVPVATQHIGLSNIPHVNDLVIISFINGDINSPIIIGRLYNDEDRPPISKMEEVIYKPPYTQNNNLKRLNITLPQEVFTLNCYDNRMGLAIGKSSINVNSGGEIEVKSSKDTEDQGTSVSMDNSSYTALTTGSGVAQIVMGDEGVVSLTTSKGKSCVISMSDNGILLDTNSDITLRAVGNLNITCDGDFSLSANSVNIKSRLHTKIKSGTTLDEESTGPMTIKSNALANIESNAMMTIKSNALANIESTGPMTIRGAIVSIN